MITLDNLSIAHGTKTIMQEISTTLASGQVHVIIGPNGTGKSTLLRTLFADLPLQSGQISWQGKSLEPGHHRSRFMQQWRHDIAYMPQDTGLDVSLSVLEIVVLGGLEALTLHIDPALLEQAMNCLQAAGIAELAHRDIGSLSGGQRQMVLFAQVLMRNARLMLLDEPVSALDLHHQIAMLDLVREQTHARDLVTVIVLHDLNLACQYADNLLVFSHGTLQASGAPQATITPALLSHTYGVSLEIVYDNGGLPMVQPLSRHHPLRRKMLVS
jgi:iron complex transport system ATP-binding protein